MPYENLFGSNDFRSAGGACPAGIAVECRDAQLSASLRAGRVVLFYVGVGLKKGDAALFEEALLKKSCVPVDFLTLSAWEHTFPKFGFEGTELGAECRIAKRSFAGRAFPSGALEREKRKAIVELPVAGRSLRVKLHHQVQLGATIVEKVSVLEFRRDAVAVIRKVRQGKRLVMTYRGRPVMRLEPIVDEIPSADDPFYKLGDLASSTAEPLTNEEIDKIVYGL